MSFNVTGSPSIWISALSHGPTEINPGDIAMSRMLATG